MLMLRNPGQGSRTDANGGAVTGHLKTVNLADVGEDWRGVRVSPGPRALFGGKVEPARGWGIINDAVV